MLVSELPFEILANIAAFSSQETKLQCTVICKAWQIPFQDSLWDTVKITDNKDDGNSVLDRITDLSKLYKKNGHRVRSLILYMDSYICGSQLQTAQEYFQRIKHLSIQQKTLHWRVSGNFTNWRAWRSLTHLEIEISKLNHGRKMDKTFEILSFLPQLTSLHIIDSGQTSQYRFTWRTMDFLHGCLPRLQTLQTKIPLIDIPIHQIKQMTNIVPAETITKVNLSLKYSSFGWVYYSNLKYPNIHTLGLLTRRQMDDYEEDSMSNSRLSNDEDMSDDDNDMIYSDDDGDQDTSEDDIEDENISDDEISDYTLEDVTKMFSTLPYFFPSLKKLEMNKNLMSKGEHDLFWKLIRKFGVSLKYLNHKCCSILMDMHNPETTVIDYVEAFSLNIETLYYQVDPNPMMQQPNMTAHPMLIHYYLYLTELNIRLYTEDMALDVLLNHCYSLKRLFLSVNELTICEDAAYRLDPHNLERLELYGVKARTSLFNYLSVRCENLTHMVFCNVRIFGPISQETGNICLDMRYTRFKVLRLGNVRFYSERDLGLAEYEYKDRMIHLITIEQIESMHNKTSPSNSLLQVPKAPTIEQLWFLYFKDKKRREGCFIAQKLNRSQARLIQDYFRMFERINKRPCDHKGNKYSKDEPEENCYWADHPPRGYVTLRCGYVANYSGKSIFESKFVTC
ncbi:hypothetical protein F4703DRAFT_1846110, partial [Phycomyces blakesleeanus]